MVDSFVYQTIHMGSADLMNMAIKICHYFSNVERKQKLGNEKKKRKEKKKLVNSLIASLNSVTISCVSTIRGQQVIMTITKRK